MSSYIASVSFGKDSLAMLLILLEKGYKLDEVVFYDTGMEFKAIYETRNRIKELLEKQGIKYTELKPKQPFLYKTILNFKRVNFIKIEPSENEFDIEINYADDEWDVIATYETFERAKEVLAEIINTYKTVARVESKDNRQPKFYNIPRVYYMPER